MIMNLILLSAMYLALPLMYVVMRNNAVAKKGIVLSVTLPAEAQEDPEVLACCQTFRKQLRTLFWALTAVLLPCLFLPWISVTMTVSLLWLLAALVLPFCLYGRSYDRLMALKRRRGWESATAGQTVVELEPMQLPKPLKPGWFVPPMILSVLPVLSCIFGEPEPDWVVILYVTAGLCLFVTGLGLVYYGLVYRQRADAVDGDRDLTAALTRVRRYNWNKFWLLATWLTAFYSLAVWLCAGSMTWYLIWTLVYSAVLLIASVQTEFAARRAQQRLTLHRPADPVVDEDAYWLWGQIYYNSNDNHNFVNERVGMGMSMNLARPAGKLLMGFCALLLLAMPLLGVWMMAEEFTPVTMRFDGETVVMAHTGEEYIVALEDVTHAERLIQLPTTHKRNGTGMKTLYKGSFYVDGIGYAKLCLNPQAGEFLLLETEGETYLFSGGPGQTADVLRAWNRERADN